MEGNEKIEKIRKPLGSGLHFCRHYNNLVKFNPEFCGKCPHNGLKPLVEETG